MSYKMNSMILTAMTIYLLFHVALAGSATCGSTFCIGNSPYCCGESFNDCCYAYSDWFAIWWIWFLIVVFVGLVSTCCGCYYRRRRYLASRGFVTIVEGAPRAYGSVEYPQYVQQGAPAYGQPGYQVPPPYVPQNQPVQPPPYQQHRAPTPQPLVHGQQTQGPTAGAGAGGDTAATK